MKDYCDKCDKKKEGEVNEGGSFLCFSCFAKTEQAIHDAVYRMEQEIKQIHERDS